MPKKILLVDDSALMRRVLCDIIDSDIRFQVTDRAKDGLEAFDLLSRNSYDAVVLDVNMPRMNGLQLLQELRKYKIPARVMMASTDTKEGARTTLDALELGALDFVHKPDSAVDCRGENFRREFLRTLNVVANSKLPTFAAEEKLSEEKGTVKEMMKIINHHPVSVSGSDRKLHGRSEIASVRDPSSTGQFRCTGVSRTAHAGGIYSIPGRETGQFKSASCKGSSRGRRTEKGMGLHRHGRQTP